MTIARSVRSGVATSVLALGILLCSAEVALGIPPWVNYDLSAPGNTAPDVVRPMPPYQWYNVPVTFTFEDIEWDDPVMGGTFGIASAYYTRDGGAPAAIVPTSTLALTQDGAYSIECQGAWGGYAYPVWLGIDASAPQLSLVVAPQSLGKATIRANASDTVSGIDHVELSLDSTSDWRSSGTLTTNAAGPHVVYGRAFDLAGNAAETSATFTVLAPVATKTRVSGPTCIRAGRTLRLTGKVRPVAARGRVVIVRERLVGRRWKHVGSATASVIRGAFSYRIKPRRGRWRFIAEYRGSVAGSTVYKSSSSAVRRVRVR